MHLNLLLYKISLLYLKIFCVCLVVAYQFEHYGFQVNVNTLKCISIYDTGIEIDITDQRYIVDN